MPQQSLVKYDTPSLLTTKTKGAKVTKGGKKLPPVEAKQPLTQTEDILNSILPPRCASEPRRLLRLLHLPGSCSLPATAHQAQRATLWRPLLASWA